MEDRLIFGGKKSTQSLRSRKQETESELRSLASPCILSSPSTQSVRHSEEAAAMVNRLYDCHKLYEGRKSERRLDCQTNCTFAPYVNHETNESLLSQPRTRQRCRSSQMTGRGVPDHCTFRPRLDGRSVLLAQNLVSLRLIN